MCCEYFIDLQITEGVPRGTWIMRFTIWLCVMTSMNVGAAQPGEPSFNQQAYAEYRARAIAAGHARNEKVVADNFFEAGNPDQAAKLYLHALAVAPDAFSAAEKKHIAARLVNANHKAEAVIILQQLLAEQKNELSEKLELVKLLAALRQNSLVITEVDALLQRDSRNKYALLMKADALRRQKKFSESLPVYRSILYQGNDFSARLGLIYSLLAVGAKAEAKNQFKLIHAENDAQHEELDALANVLDASTRPRVELVSNRYSDADKNRSVERGAIIRLVTGNVDWVADVRDKTADFEEATATAQTYSLGAASNVTDHLKVTGKYGRAKLTAEQTVSLDTGQFKVDARLGTSTVTANFSREALTATTTVIGNAIQLSKQAIELTQPFTERLKTNLAYTEKSYSDGNAANDFRATAQYVVYRGSPQVGLGYGHSRVNYKKPSSSGYSAPQNYVANQLMLTLYYETERFYADVNIVSGRESYEKNRTEKSSEFRYDAATLGMKITRRLSLDINAERSNSKGNAATSGSAEVFNDLVVGARIAYLF